MSKFKAQSTKISSNSNASLITRDITKMEAPTGNIYESLVVISKRARQISVMVKEEIQEKLSEFATTVDNLEEIHENREQIEISRFYERMPKPSTIAVDEFLEGKVYFRRAEPAALEEGKDA